MPPRHNVVGLPATPIDVDHESLQTCELHSPLRRDSNHLRASTQGHCHRRRQPELESTSAAISLTRFISSLRRTRARIHVATPCGCSTSSFGGLARRRLPLFSDYNEWKGIGF
ncbi:hypothetical protein DEO72_LG11g1856 [Vigna unguiculata]|uniref:Uncharacterized protein n=1 Tax=Vigna unguiculata TaxID=3917 RepID=A0A4D6NM00_VIGUN|nr:hypothetical protein DEO72_LG11g1856 [Vigna unguiculata]